MQGRLLLNALKCGMEHAAYGTLTVKMFIFPPSCDSDCGKLLMQMLTQSTERFTKIQNEAPLDCQNFLVQVTKYQAAKHCKVNLMTIPFYKCSFLFCMT